MAGENDGNNGAGGAGGNTTALGGAGGTGAGAGTGSDGATGTQTTNTTQVSDVAVKFPEAWGKEHAFKDFTGLAKEQGLKSEGAQKLVDLADKQVSAAVKAAVEARDAASKSEREAEHKARTEALKADKDLGGANLEKTSANIARAMAKFGSPALRAFFDKSKLGDHPELVRAFNDIGKSLAEDKLGPTGPAEKQPATATEVARTFFDHATSKSMFDQKG